MNRSKRFSLIIISLLIMSFLAIGCSSSKNISEDMAVNEDTAHSMPDMARPQESAVSEELGNSTVEPDKVITTISLSFETMEFEKTNENLNKVISKYKAYIENSSISYNQHYNNKSYRHGNFTIRVPSESVNDFKSELSGIGNMIWENTNKEDVTKQYRDTESRLRVITTKEERILSLLEKAEKVEDIITLENQLSKTIEEKEIIKTSLLNLDDKVDFSTIHIDIQEVEKLSDAETFETGFGTRIKNAFGNSLFRFKKSLEDLIIGVIYLLPFALIFGLLAFFGFKIYIKLYNKNDKS